MAVPARKTSKSKSRKRYKSNSKITFMPYNICKNCGATKIPYYICKSCGFYNSQNILNIKKSIQPESLDKK
jgi:large subunit ribosomal protein L32